MKLALREMTESHLMRDSPVIISSTIPSAKYSCCGSPLMLVNGNMAIDGLSDSAGRGVDSVIDIGAMSPPSSVNFGPRNRYPRPDRVSIQHSPPASLLNTRRSAAI